MKKARAKRPEGETEALKTVPAKNTEAETGVTSRATTNRSDGEE